MMDACGAGAGVNYATSSSSTLRDTDWPPKIDAPAAKTTAQVFEDHPVKSPTPAEASPP